MDKLVPDEFRNGLMVCVSCYLLTCAHGAEAFTLRGCGCPGHGGSDRSPIRRVPPVMHARKVATVTVPR